MLQVGESLKRFGIAGGCNDVLVASIHEGAPDVICLPLSIPAFVPLCIAHQTRICSAQTALYPNSKPACCCRRST